MEEALRRTYEAMPEPKLVLAIGDRGCTGGIFGESYVSCGLVANVIPVESRCRAAPAAGRDRARRPDRRAGPGSGLQIGVAFALLQPDDLHHP